MDSEFEIKFSETNYTHHWKNMFKKVNDQIFQKLATRSKIGFTVMVKINLRVSTLIYRWPTLRCINGVIKRVSDVYVERKTNLDAAVAPVRHRATEHENRQSSLNKLTDTLNFYQKVHISYIYTGHLLIAKQFSRFKSAFWDHSGTSFFPNSSFNRPLYL